MVDLDGHQLAVFFGANLHLDADAMGDQGAGEIFLAGGHPFDRMPGHKAGDPGNGLFNRDIGFVAKAAANIRNVHPHIRDGHVDRNAPGLRG